MDEKIIRFIYIVAMREATLQKAYNGKKRWLTDINTFKTIENTFTDFINRVIGNSFHDQKEYDESFLEVTHTICNKINAGQNNAKFTFGNAQKLINIAMKYLYIWSYKDNNNKDCFKYCHCPMDHVMLNHVWENRKLITKVNIKNYISNTFLQSWGNEDFYNNSYPQRYLDFQTAIIELADKQNPKQSRLEYDYSIWN